MGWYNSATPSQPSSNMVAGLQAGSFPFAYSNLAAVQDGLAFSTDAEHTVWTILRGTGFWLISDNKLEWIGNAGNGATVYPGFMGYNIEGRYAERFAGVQLSGIWASEYGPATNRVASPANGEVTTSEAEATVEVTWTAATGETYELSFRRTDDNNRYLVRCSQAGGTIRVYRVQAGVETELTGGTTTQTWTNGTQYRIVVKFVGTSIRVWVNTTNKNVATATSFNQSATGVKSAGGATTSNLIAWPYNISAPMTLPEDTNAYRYFVGFGDSKSSVGQWQRYFEQYLEIQTGDRWREIRGLATSGFTMSSWASAIAARLALISASPAPEFILFNVGANDVAALPVEATYKANLRTVLRALHTKWASTPIFMMDVGRLGEDADCTTISGWNAAVRAEPEFAVYVFQGPNEQGFLKGADNYTTNTWDGIHGNRAGVQATAAEWQTIVTPYL
jgi:hypothetical protein